MPKPLEQNLGVKAVEGIFAVLRETEDPGYLMQAVTPQLVKRFPKCKDIIRILNKIKDSSM